MCPTIITYGLESRIDRLDLALLPAPRIKDGQELKRKGQPPRSASCSCPTAEMESEGQRAERRSFCRKPRRKSLYRHCCREWSRSCAVRVRLISPSPSSADASYSVKNEKEGSRRKKGTNTCSDRTPAFAQNVEIAPPRPVTTTAKSTEISRFRA
jgi:hypothetical protein